MTIARSLTTSEADPPSRDDNLTIDRDGVAVRAQCRHLATVLTISGDIDARNIDRISTYATGLVAVGNALLLDLSSVGFFAAQGISVLIAVDDACRRVELPWALVTSHAVERVLHLSESDDILPTASSVPDAMQYFVLLARTRRQAPLSARRPNAHGVTTMSLGTSAGRRASHPPLSSITAAHHSGAHDARILRSRTAAAITSLPKRNPALRGASRAVGLPVPRGAPERSSASRHSRTASGLTTSAAGAGRSSTTAADSLISSTRPKRRKRLRSHHSARESGPRDRRGAACCTGPWR
jgi:anti-anti-sigma factor